MYDGESRCTESSARALPGGASRVVARTVTPARAVAVASESACAVE